MTPHLVFFDCDGVLLDSNPVKTHAFYQVGLAYGEEAAQSLARHHTANGGISRYRKFEHFFREILHRTNFDKEYEEALSQYARYVRKGLKNCPEVKGARRLLEKLNEVQASLYVVSGSDEKELREVLSERDLLRYFRAAYGSPASKKELVEKILKSQRGGNRDQWYFGDSRFDYEIASSFGIPFIMVYGHTEWKEWEQTLPREILRLRNLDEVEADKLFS